jgi:CubicO group peptidase (beta-lactamase class C family)
MKTNEFIEKYIFKPLKMNNSGFQHDKHQNESVPYEDNKKQVEADKLSSVRMKWINSQLMLGKKIWDEVS